MEVKNCNTDCFIRQLSTIEESIECAMDLIKQFLCDELEKAQIKEHLGRNSFCEYRSVNDAHYLINFLSIFRQDLDYYIKNCGDLSAEIFQKFKNRYQIDCILSGALCNTDLPIQKIYECFLSRVGWEDDVVSYDWVNFQCISE